MIQAHSLADVVDLADNPPLQYGDSSKLPGRPLVLYIARVPGSKDFFLTTVKPLDKVVRAEDVQSCLYYVHVSSEHDSELLFNDGRMPCNDKDEHEGCVCRQGHEANMISRKPVTSNAIPASDDQSNALKRPKASFWSSFQHQHNENVVRKPVPSKLQSAPAVPTQRLLGPRPITNGHSPFNSIGPLNSHLEIENRKPLRAPNTTAYTPVNPVYQARQAELDRIYKANQDIEGSISSQTSSAGAAQDSLEPGPMGQGLLTLIRRYAGAQSNVCRIDSQGGVQVSCAGYEKEFIYMPTSANRVDSLTLQQYPRGYQTAVRPYLEARKSSSSLDNNSGFSGSLTQKSPSLDLRRHSQELTDKTNMYRRSQINNGQPHIMKHLAFQTPWRSTCKFVSGIAERSFKCKHLSTTTENPVTLSELRFNLPSSQALRSNSRVPQMVQQDSSRLSLISSKHRRSWEGSQTRPASVPDEEHEARMDLSLGQEHAGGGFGGKQAKLGKLVIEPEGCQMLDLLVAANIAVWWKIYDRSI